MKTKIVSKLTDKGSLVGKPGYARANAEADVAEKARFPKGYSKLKKAEKTAKTSRFPKAERLANPANPVKS